VTYPQTTRQTFVRLRKDGSSLNEIVRRLNISKGTASLWAQGIILPERARARILSRKILGRKRALYSVQRKLQNELADQQRIFWDDFQSIDASAEVARVIASLLYWCEGGKDIGTRISFTNSDPEMVKTFLAMLAKGFNIDLRRVRPLLHVHGYHDEFRERMFWSAKIGVPLKQFWQSYKKPHTRKRIRDHYHGCLNIRYTDRRVARYMSAAREELPKILGAWQRT
jgi:hypothetical protein